jgi:eukaryotic-like serine/threonine-protein kinase
MAMPHRREAPEFASNGTTEADTFLQQRLALLHKVVFFFLGAILIANFVAIGFLFSWDRATWEQLQPHRISHLVSTLSFGITWRILARVRLRGPALFAVDAIGLVGLMASLGFMTSYVSTGRVGALDIAVSTSLILSMRAVVIPSSAKQTLMLGIVASAVCIALFTWRAANHPFELPFVKRNLPRDHAVTMVLWAGLAIAGSTIASRVIYGLRKEIQRARRIGQYELLEKIGEGGMGEVYRARHALLRRETAIKLLPRVNLGADRLQRFEREVRMTARLSHPNTVAIFDYGRTPEGLFYYAMEYLDGLDLERLVAFTGPLPVARAAYILRQILLSLTEAHEMGLVHRDIKPANVILTERGGEADVAKVVDFGLVKDLHVGDSPELTAAGSITGTPLYMAPEALNAPEEAGSSGDLYAVAAVAYYLVTGTHVFRAATVMEICAHHLHSIPEPPSQRLGRALPGSFEQLVLSGLGKRPEDRPASARAFREALDACDGIPTWSYREAHAWWDDNRGKIPSLRKSVPVDGSGRTVAVDLQARET